MHEKQCKRKGNMDIPASGERNLARIQEENDKKIVVEPYRVGEREKVLKEWFEQVKSEFLKNLIPEIRLIETNRDSLKILKQFQNNFD